MSRVVIGMSLLLLGQPALAQDADDFEAEISYAKGLCQGNWLAAPSRGDALNSFSLRIEGDHWEARYLDFSDGIGEVTDHPRFDYVLALIPSAAWQSTYTLSCQEQTAELEAWYEGKSTEYALRRIPLGESIFDYFEPDGD